MKQLLIFVVLAAALGTIYFAMDSSETQRGAPREVHLFDTVNGESISQVRIEQGKEKLDLTSKDGVWTIPDRGGYPADSTKIRALLLKVFDLSVSQRVPVSSGADADAQYEKLGVADSSVEKGQGKLSFLDSAGKLITALRLGVQLQGKKPNVFSGGGQYVRREGKPEVYAAALSIEASPKVSSWLSGEVLTILQSNIFDIEVSKDASGTKTKEFSLGHSTLDDLIKGRARDIELQGSIPEGKQLDATAVSQVAGALENLRALDVWPAGSPDIKDLQFDSAVRYRTLSGLVYVVKTATRSDQTYARIEVEFDPSIVETVQKAYAAVVEKAKAEAAPSATTPAVTPAVIPSGVPSPEASASDIGMPTASPSPIPTPGIEQPKQSSKEEAEKLNAKFSSWVYQVPQYQGTALRKTMETIMIAKPAPKTEESAAPASPEKG